LILAGTLGNLYDRLVFDGVRDFLHFYLIDWPVFNIADCCLVCGAFLLLAQAFLGRHAKETQSAAQAEKAQAMAPTK
jgi:signal peptidase II